EGRGRLTESVWRIAACRFAPRGVRRPGRPREAALALVDPDRRISEKSARACSHIAQLQRKLEAAPARPCYLFTGPASASGSPPDGFPARLSGRTMDASLLKRLIVGKPMPLAQARHERLSKTVALAVFSSDALSSVAYATEEVLYYLVLAGGAGIAYCMPISLAIGALLVIVAASYRQTIRAYPSGGGAYIVAK